MINKYKFINIILVISIQSCNAKKQLQSPISKTTKSEVFALVIDPLAPVLTVVSPTTDQILNSGTITVQITADRVTPQVKLNGKVMATTDNINFSLAYNIPYDGKYKLVAIGVINGHQGEANVTFEINRDDGPMWQYEQCSL